MKLNAIVTKYTDTLTFIFAYTIYPLYLCKLVEVTSLSPIKLETGTFVPSIEPGQYVYLCNLTWPYTVGLASQRPVLILITTELTI